MSKSTKSSTATPTLAEQKLAVINFHKGDEFEYLRQQMARDACYTSHNSIQFKLQQMLSVKEEIASLLPEQGVEVTDVKLARKVDIHEKMEAELEQLQLRHDADLEVHIAIFEGECWVPRAKKTHATNAYLEKAKAILG